MFEILVNSDDIFNLTLKKDVMELKNIEKIAESFYKSILKYI